MNNTDTKEKEEVKTQEAPLYAFYGSLRQGMYNAPILEGTEVVKEGVVKGFKLFSLGSYPCIVKSENENDTVIVEVLKVANQDVERSIHGMELGAGYTREKVDVDGTEAYIYTMPKAPNSNPIPGGDWVKYNQSR